jgi:hypothetical protein
MLPKEKAQKVHTELRRRLTHSSGGFSMSLTSTSGVSLELVWRRVGPESWIIEWKLGGNKCAASFMLGGSRDMDDAQVLRDVLAFADVPNGDDALAVARRQTRPLLGDLFLRPEINSRTPICQIAQMMGEMLWEKMAAVPIRPALGDADPAYVAPLYELRMHPDNKVLRERWLEFHALKYDPPTAAYAQVLRERLAEGAQQFSERIAIENVPAVRFNWTNLGTGAAFIRRTFAENALEQLVLLLAGTDKPAERAAIEAFVNTIMPRISPHPEKGLIYTLGHMHRPMLLNITRRPVEILDTFATATAVTYFQHIGIVPTGKTP